MTTRPTRQKHNQSRDILLSSQTLVGRELLHRLQAALLLKQTDRHLGRVETRRDRVGQDMAGTEFQSKVFSQMDGSCFGGGVAECGIFASLSGNETCNGGCDDDSGWRFLGGFGCEKGKESGRFALVLRDRTMLTGMHLR